MPAGLASIFQNYASLIQGLQIRRLLDLVGAVNLAAGGGESATGRLPLYRMIPWYIAGFVVLAGLRSADLVPHVMLVPLAGVANVLTVISMAALGFCTDLRTVARAGDRVTAAVAASLLVLGFISFGLIRLLGVA